jgi:mannose/fructose/N-acetylgalactosamine-specific phosphotransferase system component IIC
MKYIKIIAGVVIGAIVISFAAPYLVMGFVALGWTTIPIFVVGVITKIVYEIVKTKIKEKREKKV